jgi:NAD(P)-dependent dehydrogenase (short-subunit alcohol dehydrogenase family)
VPTVLVTGGSRGIGAATAGLFAANGWDVAISYRQEADAAADVVARCRAAGVRATACRADVADEADVVALFEHVDAELGPLRAFVGNAGIVGPRARVDELDGARLERMFRVNAIGAFVGAREAVRRMSTRHGGAGGSIVFVGSIASRVGSPGEYVDYAASKAAVDTLTLGLAKEVAEEGIRVNCLRPGIVETDIHASGGQPDRAERLRHLIPMQRPGRVDEIAAAAYWLASDAASYVTGVLLDAGGGR